MFTPIPRATMQYKRRVRTCSLETSNSPHHKDPLCSGFFFFCTYIYTKISPRSPLHQAFEKFLCGLPLRDRLEWSGSHSKTPAPVTLLNRGR